MAQLTDRVIREALKARLGRLRLAPRAILEEVRVHNGNAIADVVAIYRIAHCYEIKGETDSLNRLMRQASFYDQAFRRITLVTTENHLRQVEEVVPEYWGVMVATNTYCGPKLRYQRKARLSPLFNKKVALLTLWRKELVSILNSDAKLDKISRTGLSAIISDSDTSEMVSEKIAEVLANRQAASGWSVAI